MTNDQRPCARVSVFLRSNVTRGSDTSTDHEAIKVLGFGATYGMSEHYVNGRQPTTRRELEIIANIVSKYPNVVHIHVEQDLRTQQFVFLVQTERYVNQGVFSQYIKKALRPYVPSSFSVEDILVLVQIRHMILNPREGWPLNLGEHLPASQTPVGIGSWAWIGKGRSIDDVIESRAARNARKVMKAKNDCPWLRR